MNETLAVIYLIITPIYVYQWVCTRKSSSLLLFIVEAVMAWFCVFFTLAGLAILAGAM